MENESNSVEVIAVRSADSRRIGEIIGILRQIQQTGGENPEMRMKLFTRSDLKGDIRVFLFHRPPDSIPGKSRLGHTVAELLSDFGYVSHSVWLETGSF